MENRNPADVEGRTRLDRVFWGPAGPAWQTGEPQWGGQDSFRGERVERWSVVRLKHEIS